MPDNFDQLILDNRSLPEEDIASLPFGPFQAPEGSRLGAYMELAGALASFPGTERMPLEDLFPGVRSACRYTILTMETTAAAAVPGALPLAAGAGFLWSSETARSVRSAVIAAAPRSAGARDQLEPVFASRPAPGLISAPSDLGENVALLFAIDGSLKTTAGARVGFNFNWLREIAVGDLAADLGLALDSGVEAALDLSLAGSFLAAINLDRDRRLRLRVFKRSDSEVDFALNLAIAAQPRTALPEKPEHLVLAILGVHDGQWLDALARIAKIDPERIRARFGEAAGRFLDLWRNLESRAAAAIWKAAETNSDFAALRRWVHRIATELRDPESFKAALAEVLEAVPDFAASPAGIWLDAAAGGLLSAVTNLDRFQRVLRAAQAADSIMSDEALTGALSSLKHYALAQLGLANVERGLDSLASFESLDGWLRERLAAIFGEIRTDSDAGRAARNLHSIVGLARSIYSRALAALESKYSAEAGYHYARAGSGSALLDCSFSFASEGLAAYRAAFGGDFSFLSAPASGVSVHRAVLTHSLSRHAQLELHLPFLDRRQWSDRWSALARVEIEAGEDGRVFAYTMEALDSAEKKSRYQSALALAGVLLAGKEPDFTLTYTGRQMAAPGETLIPILRAYGFPESAMEAGAETSLTLSVPGSLVAAWLHAPAARSGEFFPVFSAVSVAVQRAMRQWLPCTYFSDLDRYEDLEAAYPLVVYQSMRPFRPTLRGEFTYDVMEPGTVPLATRNAVHGLVVELRRVHALLSAAGRTGTARFYEPGQVRNIIGTVQRNPRLLNALLSADAFFVDNLIRLAAQGRALNELLASDPHAGVKELAKFSAMFVATFHRRLRRLYGGRNFAQLGSLVLVEATRALGGALKLDAAIAGVLRISRGAPGQPDSLERVIVNSAFRP
jgi:hypothetical protein